ncbi:hypothetical protein [Sulfuriflexus mobilis]|uniref:hypothetical protein n=1 Tax=Sulfuriflexus mobilis TaxID=1811807 RepID=UPI000F821B24|nr:hypothetical protein [Sulfuriflexus mobilis]
MTYTVSKIEAAADQLDWAIKLFLDHKAYVPAITLAGAAEEIVGEAVSNDAAFHKLKEILSEKTGIEGKVISQEYLNKTKNWLKHWKCLKDDETIEIELEKEAIQYLVRAMTNFVTHDNAVTSETPRFYEWLVENKKELINGL